jgi:hypothetical protein
VATLKNLAVGRTSGLRLESTATYCQRGCACCGFGMDEGLLGRGSLRSLQILHRSCERGLTGEGKKVACPGPLLPSSGLPLKGLGVTMVVP